MTRLSAKLRCSVGPHQPVRSLKRPQKEDLTGRVRREAPAGEEGREKRGGAAGRTSYGMGMKKKRREDYHRCVTRGPLSSQPVGHTNTRLSPLFSIRPRPRKVGDMSLIGAYEYTHRGAIKEKRTLARFEGAVLLLLCAIYTAVCCDAN